MSNSIICANAHMVDHLAHLIFTRVFLKVPETKPAMMRLFLSIRIGRPAPNWLLAAFCATIGVVAVGE